MIRTIRVLVCDACGKEILREGGPWGANPRDGARKLGFPVRYGPGYRKGHDRCRDCIGRPIVALTRRKA